MSQNTIRLGLAANGSITALSGSGIRIMSDSLIAFQPAMEEPSNMMPSRKASSSIVETCCAVCCHLPRGSVKRRSTYSTECSVIISITLATLPLPLFAGFLAMPVIPRPQSCFAAWVTPVAGCGRWLSPHRAGPHGPAPLLVSARSRKRFIAWLTCLDGVLAAFAGADANDLLDGGDEDLPVTDPPGAGGRHDRLHRAFDQAVLADHLDFHLGQEIHHVFGATIEL